MWGARTSAAAGPTRGAAAAARAARSGYLGKSHRTIVRAQFVLVAVDANSSLVERVGVVFSLGSGLTKGAPEPFVPISC